MARYNLILTNNKSRPKATQSFQTANGDSMNIKQYDRVLLNDGNKASIVEIFDNGKLYLADIDKDGDTYTEEIDSKEIEKIILSV